jgi:hypothetical protein
VNKELRAKIAILEAQVVTQPLKVNKPILFRDE